MDDDIMGRELEAYMKPPLTQYTQLDKLKNKGKSKLMCTHICSQGTQIWQQGTHRVHKYDNKAHTGYTNRAMKGWRNFGEAFSHLIGKVDVYAILDMVQSLVQVAWASGSQVASGSISLAEEGERERDKDEDGEVTFTVHYIKSENTTTIISGSSHT